MPISLTISVTANCQTEVEASTAEEAIRAALVSLKASGINVNASIHRATSGAMNLA